MVSKVQLRSEVVHTFEIGICLIILLLGFGMVNLHLFFGSSDSEVVVSRIDNHCHLSYKISVQVACQCPWSLNTSSTMVPYMHS